MSINPPLLRRAQPWLGTMVEITLVDPGTASTRAAQQTALTEAFDVVAAVHMAMSPQLPESDLARFNRAGSRRLTAHRHTLHVLRMARALGAASDGAFDATQGHGGAAGWALESDWLVKRDPRAALDLGGIAKGYAVDAAVETLQAHGIAAGCVNAGGDLRVFGSHYVHPVHIRSAHDAAQLHALTALSDGAIATSVLLLAQQSGSAGDGALKRARAVAHISVAAPSCMLADALTKVVAYGRPEVCENLLRHHSATAWRHADF